MGADLLLCYCYLPQTADGDLLGWDEVRDQIVGRIHALSDEDLLAVADEAWGESWEEDWASMDPEDLEDSMTPTKTRQLLLDSAKLLTRQEARDLAGFKIEGKWLIFTGGMSWGDTTESWNDIIAVAVSEITTEPFERRSP